jgi:flagellin
MAVINTNSSATIAANALVKNEREINKAMNQLSTGSRINRAADDAAGLGVSIVMTSQINGLNQSVRNANDGISLAQTADGALSEATGILQRMRELAVQAGNAVLSDNQQDYLSAEFNALAEALGTVANNTSFNGVPILTNDGSGTATENTYVIRGSDASTTMATVKVISLDVLATDAQALDISSSSAAPATGPAASVAALDTALDTIGAGRAELGAAMNTLAYVSDAQMVEIANTEISRSRIADTDYAAATTELARVQIIQQAGTSMLAQANQMPQSVLSLLQ